MSSNSVLKSALALAAACTLWAGSAQAATIHNITLTGNGGDGFHFPPFSIGPSTFEQWSLGLNGLDDDHTITVEAGDTINATVTLLDGPFTIPGSIERTNFGLYLSGTDFPPGDTLTNSQVLEFFNGPDLVASGGSSSGTTGGLSADAGFFAPNSGPITFDSVTVSFYVKTLSAPAILSRSSLSYVLVSPSGAVAVPEPATWAMMIMGFGGVGALMRRNRRDRGLAAYA